MTESIQVSFIGTLLAALTFFTRLPRIPYPSYSANDDKYAAAFAPWVGWLVAVVAIGVLKFGYGWLPVPVIVTLMMIATVWFTGALHEDGFADYCDAFGTQRSREQTLEIMRDPRVGVFGVVGLVLALLLKFSLLSALVNGLPLAATIVVIVVAHTVSRFVAVSFMSTHGYARRDDETAKAGKLSTGLPLPWLLWAMLGATIPLLAAAWWVAWSLLWIVPALIGVRIWFALSFQRRLGGYTGDCLGAAQQASELVILLVVAAAWLI